MHGKSIAGGTSDTYLRHLPIGYRAIFLYEKQENPIGICNTKFDFFISCFFFNSKTINFFALFFTDHLWWGQKKFRFFQLHFLEGLTNPDH